MADKIRILSDLAPQVKTQRESAGLSKTELAQRAGKVREVIYRLESGEDVTVSSLLAVLGGMGLALQIVKAGLPTMQEVAARFAEDEE
ncbi:transcriptional regulator [Achromobacter aloeverae]|uniref:Transcriptional regulator n=2 Tax=Achromobacter aloeverae TaxID=1750518 RepID=A0A4Q1HDG0_9BURK|nr:transcriptional regulator [Achromobacter aloeverae]